MIGAQVGSPEHGTVAVFLSVPEVDQCAFVRSTGVLVHMRAIAALALAAIGQLALGRGRGRGRLQLQSTATIRREASALCVHLTLGKV